MTRALLIALAAGLSAAASAAAPPPGTGFPEGFALLDRIRAIVDEEVITDFELERTFAPLSGLGHGILDEGEREKWFESKRKEVLQELIDSQLMLGEARKMDLDVQPQRVAEHMRELRDQNRLADDAALEAFVKAQGFRSVDHYQDHVEKEMLKADAVRYKIAGRVRPSKDEVQRVFLRDFHGGKKKDEIHAQHIMVKVPQMVTAVQIRELSEKVSQIRNLALTEQQSFEDLAREYSDDLNAQKGGDLGFFGRCILEPDFERAAFALKVGQISDVIQTSKGYHIVRVLDRRVVPIDDEQTILSCIRRDLEIEKAERAYDALVKELRVYHHVKELR